MRHKFGMILIFFIVSFMNCLTYQSINYTVIFSDDYDYGTIDVRFENLCSSAVQLNSNQALTREQQEKVQDDFSELIGYVTDTPFLLDGVEQGLYIYKRELLEQKEQLDGHYQALFRKIKNDSWGIHVTDDSVIVKVKKENPTDKIMSSGMVKVTADSICVSWPKKKKIQWKIVFSSSSNDFFFSLLPLFREYKKKHSKAGQENFEFHQR